jgi:putative transposase
MIRWLGIFFGTLRSGVRTRRELALENLVLRQQLAVWKARQPLPRLTQTDRMSKHLIALDFFTVPTATFRVLFVLVMLTHSRRRLVHFNVTEHPTAEWTARQLLETCGLEEGPRYLIRDRDRIYGERFSIQAKTLDIREAVIAPHSPWQNAYAERVIGSIRRECLDHVVVIGERHLREILSKYVAYYNRIRTHLSLTKDTPEHRVVQRPDQGRVVEVPCVGGLHHEYLRRSA